MLKGFKDFILKGNVIELATAVIIGTAFTAIVTAFSDKIIKPLIAAIPGGNAADGFGFRVVGDKAATFVDIGAVITAAINFVIIAAVVYFIIIVPYNKLAELGGFGKKSEVTEVALLSEIRDLLDPEGASKAKAAAEAELPDHLKDPGGPGLGAPLDPGTQRLTAPPAGAPQTGGNPPYPTPQPAPGSYPPPGSYPQQGGNYPPQQYPQGGPQGGQYPGDFNDQGRHSR